MKAQLDIVAGNKADILGNCKKYKSLEGWLFGVSHIARILVLKSLFWIQ